MGLIVNENMIDLNEYKKQLAKFNLNKKELRNIELQKLNARLSRLLADESIFNTYDYKTGAIFFSDDDWELIDNDEVKNVFTEEYKEDQYKYILHTNDGVLLRGVDTYYFNVSKQKKGMNPTKNQVLTWRNNYIEFFKKISVVIERYPIENKNNLKFILAILDHMRDLFIQLIYIKFSMDHDFANCLDEFSDSLLNDLESTDRIIIELVLNDTPNFKNILNNMRVIIDKLINKTDVTLSNLLNFNDNNLYRKVIRIHRETDNFWENYIGIKYCINNLNKENYDKKKKINLIGILYGGLELTLLAKIFLKDLNPNIYFINYRKDYLDRVNNRYMLKIEGSIDPFLNSINILVDDNILTARTLNDISKFLKLNSIDIGKYMILRHPELNRITQMVYYKSFLNLNIVEEKILGLIMPSPYSKIKNNTNIRNEFLDELGIFTLSGYKFSKYIYKNGVYENNTEISVISDFFREGG